MGRFNLIITLIMLFAFFTLQQNITYGEQLLFENVNYQKLDNIRVIVDENQIFFDVEPQIINGVIY